MYTVKYIYFFTRLYIMPHFLIHNKQDNVGVAVVDIKAGEEVEGVYIEDMEIGPKIKALNDIPLGHKIALTNIKKGDVAIKYGRPIGIAISDIKVGEHVHIHNIKSIRWGNLKR
ncbi:dehydratase [Sulfurisphaera ohwakuensis]